jgi:putative ABC transport system permease protein
MKFPAFILKNVLRRPVRSSLTVVGVSVAVGAVVSLMGISGQFEKSFRELYAARGVDLVVVRSGRTDRLSSNLSEELGPKIRELPGVADVAPSLVDAVSFEELNLFGVGVQGWIPDSYLFTGITIQEGGRMLKPDEERAVILGSVLAENLEKQVGDVLEIFEDEPFQVVGIYKSFNVFENGAMVISFSELQRLMDRQGQVTAYMIAAEDSTDPTSIDRLRVAVEDLAPGITALPTEDFVNSTVQIRMAHVMAVLTSVIALAIGSVSMLNTMLMAVFERTREIGILRAIGWRKPRIVSLILGESLLISLIGAVIGTLGAIATINALTLLPATSGVISGQLPPRIVLLALGMALVLGILGGVYPAIRAARMVPNEAIRHD